MPCTDHLDRPCVHTVRLRVDGRLDLSDHRRAYAALDPGEHALRRLQQHGLPRGAALSGCLGFLQRWRLITKTPTRFTSDSMGLGDVDPAVVDFLRGLATLHRGQAPNHDTGASSRQRLRQQAYYYLARLVAANVSRIGPERGAAMTAYTPRLPPFGDCVDPAKGTIDFHLWWSTVWPWRASITVTHYLDCAYLTFAAGVVARSPERTVLALHQLDLTRPRPAFEPRLVYALLVPQGLVQLGAHPRLLRGG